MKDDPTHDTPVSDHKRNREVMHHETKSARPSRPSQAPKDANLQSDAQTSEESAWFFAWFKSAMLYLAAVTAYLSAVTALVVAWKKFIAAEGQKADFTIYITAGLLALPLLLAFFFNLLPAIHRRRERRLRPVGRGAHDYFDTGPRINDPYGFFGESYRPFLQWASEQSDSILYLTGLSGSGKSSLLCAYLKPNLAQPNAGGKTTKLIVIRSYDDPLASLKRNLLNFWKKKPDDYDDLTPLEALHRAAGQLGKSQHLLIAFDQFEEFFLLRAATPDSGSADIAPRVSESLLNPIKHFLQRFRSDRPDRVTVLLSYREDHHRLMAPLDLPARVERQNWMTVDPLDFAAATEFLRSCPGLSVPDDRMQRVLREAVRQEGGRVVMRPIVANLLGMILRQMSNHPTLWRRKTDLLRGYVRDCLGNELQQERASVLQALLTAFHTAQPRLAVEISKEIGIEAGDLDVHLAQFQRAGLVRCINLDEPAPSRRVWQIAHDFLATLVERVLDSLQQTLWRTFRPWLAPALCILLATVSALVWPAYQEQRAVKELERVGFAVNSQQKTLSYPRRVPEFGPMQGFDIPAFVDPSDDLASVASSFRAFKPKQIWISLWDKLISLKCLQDVESVEALQLKHCPGLRSLSGLETARHLTNLQILAYNDEENRDSAGIIDLLPLRNLPLEHLSLSGCTSLSELSPLEKAPLRSLDLSGCTAISDLSTLAKLNNLRQLRLSKCTAISELNPLAKLNNLQDLDLSYCSAISDLSPLAKLANSQHISPLAEPAILQHLNLSGCTAISDLSPLAKFNYLQQLDLSGCTAISAEQVSAFKKDHPEVNIEYP